MLIPQAGHHRLEQMAKAKGSASRERASLCRRAGDIAAPILDESWFRPAHRRATQGAGGRVSAQHGRQTRWRFLLSFSPFRVTVLFDYIQLVAGGLSRQRSRHEEWQETAAGMVWALARRFRQFSGGLVCGQGRHSDGLGLAGGAMRQPKM